MRRARLQYPRSHFRGGRGLRGPRGGRGARRGGYVPYLPSSNWERDDGRRSGDERISYFCELCKQQMSSKGAYITHCNSAFHKEKEAKEGEGNTQLEWLCDTCSMSFKNKLLLDQHCLVFRHQAKYRVGGAPKGEGSGKSDGDATDKIGVGKDGLPEKKQLFSFGPLKPPNYCDVCEVDCMNSVNMRVHLESWRHRAAADRKKEEEEQQADKLKGTAQEKSGDGLEVWDFFCDICNSHWKTLADYISHIYEKRHKRLVSDMQPPFHCFYCSLKLGSVKDLNEHYESEEHARRARKPAAPIAEGNENPSEQHSKWKKINEEGSDREDSRSAERKHNRKRERSSDHGKESRRKAEGSNERSKREGRDNSLDRGRKTESHKQRARKNSIERLEGDERQKERGLGNAREKDRSRKEKNKGVVKEKDRAKEGSRKTYKKKSKESSIERYTKASKSRKWNTSSSDDEENSGSGVALSPDSPEGKRHRSRKARGKRERKSKENDSSSSKDSDEGRKVEIKGRESDEDVDDLRDKLKRGKKIVITRKLRSENEGHVGASREANVSVRLDAGDNEIGGKRDQELILSRHKADLVLREQLLKEHTLEIFKYRDAEEEYKRLCLEEEYLGRRLELFKDGDPRKISDKSDLTKIQAAIKSVREELEVRDLMIQEKERYLVVLKNRIEERGKIVAEVDTKTDPKVSQEVEYETIEDAEMKEHKEGESPSRHLMMESKLPDPEEDLRLKIEKERLMRKLAPEMEALDPVIRQRLLNALTAPESAEMQGRENAVVERKRKERNRLTPLEEVHARGSPTQGHFSQSVAEVLKPLKTRTATDSTNQAVKFDDPLGASFSTEKACIATKPPSEQRPQNALFARQEVRDISDYKETVKVKAIEQEATEDMEQFWVQKERELRRREEELRRREFELLEREKKRKMEDIIQDESNWAEESERKHKSFQDQRKDWQQKAEANLTPRIEKTIRIENPSSDGLVCDEVEERFRGNEDEQEREESCRGRSRSSERLVTDRTQMAEQQEMGCASPESNKRQGSSEKQRESPAKKKSAHRRRRSRSSSSSPESNRNARAERKGGRKRRHSNRAETDVLAKALDTLEKVRRMSAGPFGAPGFHAFGQGSGFENLSAYGQLNLPDMISNAGIYEGLDSQEPGSSSTGSALKELKRLDPTPTDVSKPGNKRREQFALWKSGVSSEDIKGTAPVKEDSKEDIWDTAFETGNQEEEDKEAIGIFADLDVDNDYLKGRLHRMSSTNPTYADKKTFGEMPGGSSRLESNSDVPGIEAESSARGNFSKVSQQHLELGKAEQVRVLNPEVTYGSTQKRLYAQFIEARLKEEEAKEQVAGGSESARDTKAAPRSILKKGILKKPSENFFAKDERHGKLTQQMKERAGSSEALDTQPERTAEALQPKDGKPGVLSPEDLERVRMIIDGLKKQYGPGWDSSQIEADLKLMLERQASVPSADENVQSATNQSGSLERPPNPNKAIEGSESNVDHREDKGSTLFPIKVPDTVVSKLGSKHESNIARSKLGGAGGMQSKQSLSYSHIAGQESFRSSAPTESEKPAIETPRPLMRSESPLGQGKVKQLEDYGGSGCAITSEAQFVRQNRADALPMTSRRDYQSDAYLPVGLQQQKGRSGGPVTQGMHYKRATLVEEGSRRPLENSSEGRVMPRPGMDERELPRSHHTPSMSVNRPFSDRVHIARQHLATRIEETNQVQSMESHFDYLIEEDKERHARSSGTWQGARDAEGQFQGHPRHYNPGRHEYPDNRQVFGGKIKGQGQRWPERSDHILATDTGSMPLLQGQGQGSLYREEGKDNRSYGARPLEITQFTEKVISSEPREWTGSQGATQALTKAPTFAVATDRSHAPEERRNFGELFQTIFRVKPEDISKGMYFCSACKVFIGSDMERTTHAHTEEHKKALRTRQSCVAAQGQSSSQIRLHAPAHHAPAHHAPAHHAPAHHAPAHHAPAHLKAALPTSHNVGGQLRPRPSQPLGGRGQSVSAYGTHGMYPRPSRGMPPRFSGPH